MARLMEHTCYHGIPAHLLCSKDLTRCIVSNPSSVLSSPAGESRPCNPASKTPFACTICSMALYTGLSTLRSGLSCELAFLHHSPSRPTAALQKQSLSTQPAQAANVERATVHLTSSCGCDFPASHSSPRLTAPSQLFHL